MKLHSPTTTNATSSNLGVLFSFPRFAPSDPREHPHQRHPLLHSPGHSNHAGNSPLHVQRFRQALWNPAWSTGVVSFELHFRWVQNSTSTSKHFYLTQRQTCLPRCQKTGLPECKWQFIDMDVHRSVRYDCQSGEKRNYPTRGNLGSTLWWSIWINAGIKLYLWRCNQKDVCLDQKIKWIKLCNIL